MRGIEGKYIKEFLKTYLVLPFFGGAEEAYKIKMLENNPTPGILAPEIFVEAESCDCRFDIGGRKPMDLVFRTLCIDLRNLITILNSFVSACEAAAELMLDPGDLVLKPEYVFVDITDYKAAFPYLPGLGKKGTKQTESFFEYMLNRVDYDDKKAVALLYDCYIIAMKEERGLPALKERIEKEAPALKEALNTEMMAFENKAFDVVTKNEPSLKSWFKDRFKKKQELEKKPVESKPETLPEDEPKETVLLSVRKQEAYPTLTCLKNGERIIIDKLPFIIGSLSGHTDYAPMSRNVSRLHAEVRRYGSEVVLVDLNSTNGTKVNGSELVPGEERTLYDNDAVCLADMDFVYNFKG